MVFNLKKLLNFGVDLTLQRRGKKKRYRGRMSNRFCRFRLLMTGFHRQTDISTTTSTNSFLDNMHSPRSKGCILMEICLLVDFGAGVCQIHPAAVGGIPVSADRPPYPLDLNLLDFSI
jgi:hypothetical protein